MGDTPTKVEWRLFPTLVRFDSMYVTHFKRNLRRIEDYPNLSNYLRDLYQAPGVTETVAFDHIKQHYFLSLRHLNPSDLVPKGPRLDYSTVLDWERFTPNGKRKTT